MKTRIDDISSAERSVEERSHEGSASGVRALSAGRGTKLPLLLWIVVFASLSFVAMVLFVMKGLPDDRTVAGPSETSAKPDVPTVPETSGAIRVEVVKPETKGLGRKTTQPGTVHAFEYAELYAKVSGYLGEQNVDIGDHIKRGQLLARIDVPELDEDVKEAAASLERAKSAVAQSAARVKTAEAEAEAAIATVKTMEANVISAEGQVKWRKSEFDRMKELVIEKAIEKKLEDERRNAWTASTAAKLAADAAVDNARAQLNAAKARIVQANADLLHAKAEVDVEQAVLDKSRVLLSYTRIESPYDGVITSRNFHRGAFIRAPNDGGNVPLLTVARTDKMRVVVQVPDLDVPYTSVGDKATIEIDALPGRHFKGALSRMADFEDPRQKTMRVEIDLPNPDGLLREGMYGRRTTIELESPSSALNVPSTALIGKTIGDEGAVYVVSEGKAHLAPIRIGQDDGLHMEVLSGLSPTDDVVVHYNGAISDGTPVEATAAREDTEHVSSKSQKH